jgi:hypothetical protein
VKLDTAIAGLVGAAIGVSIIFLANTVSAQIPTLVAHPVGVGVIFLILLGFTIAEMPVMLFGLKKIAASTTPRAFLLFTFLVYVMFASVYASIFVLLTTQTIWVWVLGAGIVARFATGTQFK